MIIGHAKEAGKIMIISLYLAEMEKIMWRGEMYYEEA
jgi:hypothetical protein